MARLSKDSACWRQLGVDPDRLTGLRKPASSGFTPAKQANELEKLRKRHDSGELSNKEYERARDQLRRY